MAGSDRRFSSSSGVLSRRTLVKGVGAVAGSLALGAPGQVPSAAGQESSGGVLRIAFSDALTKDSMNPAISQDNFFIVPPQSTMYESLVKLDNDFQPTRIWPRAGKRATTPRRGSSGCRQGVEFHDGATMTANDVVYVAARVDGSPERHHLLRAAQGSAQAGKHHRGRRSTRSSSTSSGRSSSSPIRLARATRASSRRAPPLTISPNTPNRHRSVPLSNRSFPASRSPRPGSRTTGKRASRCSTESRSRTSPRRPPSSRRC